MRTPRALALRANHQVNLRVIVKAVSPQPNPYAWIIFDDAKNEVVERSSDRFRTQMAAWQAGVAVLAGKLS